MSLTAQVKLAIAASQLNALDLGTGQYPVNFNNTVNLANGTGANQANMIFTDTRTLSASANEDLDLAGSLVDAFGNTITFTKLKGIIVTADAGNTNNVQVTRPASNGVPLLMAAGDGIALTPGASFYAMFPGADGVAVTASTGDLINIANSAGSTSVTYSVILIGVAS
ncbi:MAG: hypothetical protein RKH07_12715 [Gammaproteobacteria bacterium]